MGRRRNRKLTGRIGPTVTFQQDLTIPDRDRHGSGETGIRKAQRADVESMRQSLIACCAICRGFHGQSRLRSCGARSALAATDRMGNQDDHEACVVPWPVDHDHPLWRRWHCSSGQSPGLANQLNLISSLPSARCSAAPPPGAL